MSSGLRLRFFFHLSPKRPLKIFSSQDQPDDHRRADEGRHRVQGQYRIAARELGQKIGGKGRHGAQQGRGRQEPPVVRAVEKHPAQVGHGHADEGHRPAEGGGGARQKRCQSDDCKPKRSNAELTIFR